MSDTNPNPSPDEKVKGAVHKLLSFLPEGVADFAIFLFGHWLVEKAGKWTVDKKKVMETVRQMAPHLKKNYEDEVLWGQLLDLLNFQLQIGVTDWMAETLGPVRHADMILSLYENIRDDDPEKAKAKLAALATTLEQFARITDPEQKLNYAVGRCWIKRAESDYPIHWELIQQWMDREAAAINAGTDAMNARLERHQQGLWLMRPIRRYFRGLGATFTFIPDNTHEVPVIPIQPQAPAPAAGTPGRMRRLINAWRG